MASQSCKDEREDEREAETRAQQDLITIRVTVRASMSVLCLPTLRPLAVAVKVILQLEVPHLNRLVSDVFSGFAQLSLQCLNFLFSIGKFRLSLCIFLFETHKFAVQIGQFFLFCLKFFNILFRFFYEYINWDVTYVVDQINFPWWCPVSPAVCKLLYKSSLFLQQIIRGGPQINIIGTNRKIRNMRSKIGNFFILKIPFAYFYKITQQWSMITLPLHCTTIHGEFSTKLVVANL